MFTTPYIPNAFSLKTIKSKRSSYQNLPLKVERLSIKKTFSAVHANKQVHITCKVAGTVFIFIAGIDVDFYRHLFSLMLLEYEIPEYKRFTEIYSRRKRRRFTAYYPTFQTHIYYLCIYLRVH